MREHPERLGDVMHLVGALRNLERLADHATNIAEDVIFVVQGGSCATTCASSRSATPGPPDPSPPARGRE
jgi:phosphate uptake regulator